MELQQNGTPASNRALLNLLEFYVNAHRKQKVHSFLLVCGSASELYNVNLLCQ